MKKHFYLFIAFSMVVRLSGNAFSQPKSLFVNDNGLFSSNTDTVKSALDAAGIEYDIFSTRDSLRSPTAAEMFSYPLVIWYCSTDGVGNYLWNANNTDNTDLLTYLENGGKLWLMGSDFLYDRYGSAPDVFVPGDFPYDVLGISAYNAQSYGDDGGLGVAELEPTNLPLVGIDLDTIHWVYPTAWWVDGCTPSSEAISFYEMGPATYPLQGLSSAVYRNYEQFSGDRELTLFFDPALMDTYQNRVHLFLWAYSSFFLLPPGFGELGKNEENLIQSENPALGRIQCKVPETMAGNKFSVGIYDLNGKLVLNQQYENSSNFSVEVSMLKSGMYLLRISDNSKTCYQKFVVSK
ncbi:MAG: T9SS type A sorting domain-containing protein [Bacteroidales bacterium]